jgi:hypothetical protein
MQPRPGKLISAFPSELHEGDQVLYEDGSVAYSITGPLMNRGGFLEAEVRWHDGGFGRRSWEAHDASHFLIEKVVRPLS